MEVAIWIFVDGVMRGPGPWSVFAPKQQTGAGPRSRAGRSRQGTNPSNTIWSAQTAARRRCSSVRTVQVMTGRPIAVRQR